jgi:hypothetical protein
VCLTETDLRQIELMKRNNEAFAKKLLLEAEKKLSIEQKVIIN